MGFSRCFLMSVNSLMALLALVTAGTAIYGLTDSSFIVSAIPDVVPSYTFTAGLVFAGAVMVIALMGLCSAKYQNKCGLMVYMVVVLLALVAEGTVSGYLLTKGGVIHDAKAENLAHAASREVRKFENDLLEFATGHADEWVQTQDALSCCGYDIRAARGGNSAAAADVDTGAQCDANRSALAAIVNDTTTYPTLKDAQEAVDAQLGADFFCKNSVLDFAEEYSKTLGIAAGALAFVELLCLCSAVALGCCTSKKDGGFREDFYATAEPVEQNAGSLAGTAQAEGAPISTANAAYTYA